MLRYNLVQKDPRTLALGGHLPHISFYWRPYDKRDPEARADYDRLRESLKKEGKMRNPLIIWRDMILLGMRRAEIAIELGWESVPCWEITSDITDLWDPKPITDLMDHCYEKVAY